MFSCSPTAARTDTSRRTARREGDAKSVEFQRLVNHVDVDGDGADEIIVEAWKYGSDNDLVVLKFAGGKWQEVLRVKQDWCLEAPKTR